MPTQGARSRTIVGERPSSRPSTGRDELVVMMHRTLEGIPRRLRQRSRNRDRQHSTHSAAGHEHFWWTSPGTKGFIIPVVAQILRLPEVLGLTQA